MTITLTIDIDTTRIRTKRDLDVFEQKMAELKRQLLQLRDLCDDEQAAGEVNARR